MGRMPYSIRNPDATADRGAATLKPTLSLFDSATIVAGSMIGSGIFIVSADIVRHVQSPAALLSVWIVAGLMTIAGALAYGELAAMMPYAGGQYVFLREAYGGLPAFMFGWTLLLVIQTGTIAAVAVAFARFTAVFWPAIGGPAWLGSRTGIGLSPERLAAIAVIIVLTAANLRGLDAGRFVQNLFTSVKALSLVLIATLACLIAPNRVAIAINFHRAFFAGGGWSASFAASFGAAMVGALFSADAWAGVTFTAAEIRDPRRNLPRALALGTAAVIVLYVLTNIAYLCELPAAALPGVGLPISIAGSDAGIVFANGIAHAANDRVAEAALSMIWGPRGAALAAALVIVSTFGCANGLILTGARVFYAMARDGLFFAVAGRLNAKSVPAIALMMQALWASVLTLTGTYSELLDYVIFAQLMFYALTVGAVFVMRVRDPNRPRPYRAWGYPILPAAYITAATLLMADLLVVKPAYTWPGLLIALAGAPVYAIRRRSLDARSK
ncbi:MAG TPA: amino acid permease [Candidatus Binataceae bacterium]|nr:amino acid permease [Candidatus Binataceae bacterium]